MLKLMSQQIEDNHPVHAAVVHVRAFEEALALETEISTRFNCAELYNLELGPVFGTHTGPGTLGLAFYSD